MKKKEGTFYSLNFLEKDDEPIEQEASLNSYTKDMRTLNDIPDNGQGGHLIREESCLESL